MLHITLTPEWLGAFGAFLTGLAGLVAALRGKNKGSRKRSRSGIDPERGSVLGGGEGGAAKPSPVSLSESRTTATSSPRRAGFRRASGSASWGALQVGAPDVHVRPGQFPRNDPTPWVQIGVGLDGASSPERVHAVGEVELGQEEPQRRRLH